MLLNKAQSSTGVSSISAKGMKKEFGDRLS
jgi:hypothetical protein